MIVRVRVLLVAFGLLSACQVTGTFECGLDEVCRRGNDLGVCEVEGYCSFGDAACPSGRRYADNAGDGFANECVSDMAEPLTCLERWKTDVVHFGAVTDLGVNSPQDDRDPWMSSAGNTLLFSSTRGGTTTGADIYLASRADTTVPFGAPAIVGSLSSAQSDSRTTVSADLLTIYFNSSRAGGKGGSDVWRATRTTPTSGLSSGDQATLDLVNTPDDEHDAALSNSGLHLYLASSRTGITQRLVMATRTTTADAFDTPSVITELDVGDSNADPAVSPDELLMVFTSTRASELGGSNLWYTTRARITEKWLPPRIVPDVNIAGEEGDAHLADDGCTLVFSRATSAIEPRDLVYAVVTP